MNRMLTGIVFLLTLSVHLSVLAQSSSARSATKQTHAEALSQADSLDFVKSLNDSGKLIAEAVIPNVKLSKLDGEDCFGIRLANNLRLAGHSPRSGYGYSGKLSQQQKDGTFKDEYFQWIGVLYSESAFSIGDQQFPAGPYVIQAFGDSLRLAGNDEKASYFDPRRRKQVPLPITKKLSVKTPIPDDVAKGTQGATFSLIVKEGVAAMNFLGNEWKIVPR